MDVRASGRRAHKEHNCDPNVLRGVSLPLPASPQGKRDGARRESQVGGRVPEVGARGGGQWTMGLQGEPACLPACEHMHDQGLSLEVHVYLGMPHGFIA